VRSIGMDVHPRLLRDRDRRGRSGALGEPGGDGPADAGLVRAELGRDRRVAIEATSNALAIARILEPHVGRVVLVNPKAVRENSRRAKTDRIDAKVLAQLLAVGFLDQVWTPDEATRARRRLISRRGALVRQRTREKNQIHAALHRNLVGRAPVSDLFGVKGRQWLDERVPLVPLDERLTVAACLRQLEFIAGELAQLDRILAADALSDEAALRLMTLPGVGAVTAIGLLGAIGDVRRFPTPRHLVGYLGLDPTVRQSGNEPAKHGRISKQGPGEVRGLLVEAAWHAGRTAGPLRAFHERLADRRGGKIATAAVARKLGDHRLAPAQPRRELRVHAARPARGEDPQARARGRRQAPARQETPRPRLRAALGQRRRTRAGRRAGGRLPATDRRLAAVEARSPEDGCGRATGTRIS
jgi:transposase